MFWCAVALQAGTEGVARRVVQKFGERVLEPRTGEVRWSDR